MSTRRFCVRVEPAPASEEDGRGPDVSGGGYFSTVILILIGALFFVLIFFVSVLVVVMAVMVVMVVMVVASIGFGYGGYGCWSGGCWRGSYVAVAVDVPFTKS